MPAKEVRTYVGTPPVPAFGATGGTPIVIDTTTAKAYFLAPGDVVTPLAAAGGGGTVTNTPGPLGLGLVVVGNGVNDEKVLAASTDGFYLKQVAGVAAWAAAAGGTVTSVAITSTGGTVTVTGSPITGAGTINLEAVAVAGPLDVVIVQAFGC